MRGGGQFARGCNRLIVPEPLAFLDGAEITFFIRAPDDFPDFNLLSSSIDKSLAGIPAYILKGNYRDIDSRNQTVLEIGMIKDNINYLIRYIATPSQYLNYLDNVETMIDSFEIQK